MAGTSRWISWTVVLVVATTIAVYAATRAELIGTLCYLAVLVGASVGAWIGAEHAPHQRRLVPRLIATGVSLTALGDVVWSVLDVTGRGTDVSVADPFWFLSYVVLCAALWLVLRRRQCGGRGVDVDSLIDAVTIVVVSVLIFWSFSVHPIVADTSMTPLVRAVWASYPIADAVLLGLVVRILMSRSARTSFGASFAVGVCLWLAADIAHLQSPEDGVVVLLMNLAWVVAPVLMARTAWRVGEPQAGAAIPGVRTGWGAQLMVAVGPLLVPPALHLVAHVRGEPDQPLQLFLGMTALIALAFVRTARLMGSEERAYRKLEEARDAALQASRAKSMFLANMSHEIRTPLTTMLASAEILEDTPLDDLQRDLVGKMNRSGDLLKTLVEGVLDFSRIEAGQLELASATFDLHAMVADADDVYVPRGREAGVRFESRVDPGVPRLVVGDPGRLFQVLSNLLENAMKFTHEGTVSLVVRSVRPGGEGDGAAELVEITVTDTGIGIGAEDQESVFESFRQVDGTMTRRYGGSGLGLAICRELTQLMGGSITLESRLGTGSTFVVRLPLLPAPGEDPPVAREQLTTTS